jgi:hypothetical protein
MGEEQKRLAQSMVEAFSFIFGMYEEAIEKIPDAHWRSGDNDYLIPARLILHAIETGDFYSSKSPENFPWGQRFGRDSWGLTLEDLPSKMEISDYHNEVRSKVEVWLSGMSDEVLVSREDAFPWTGSTRLGRALYLLGHYRQHFGEVNAELRIRGLSRIAWRTF